MIDMTETIEPKSDQLNADDLLAGSKTITITGVKKCAGDQPVSINYEGDNGKPFKPCKSMRRVLVKIWGKDGEKYIGRSMTLYCDPEVTWAGSEVGGIRISHMSDIVDPFHMMLTKSRGKRSKYTVKPLATEPLNPLSDEEFERLSAEINAADTMADLQPIGAEIKAARFDAVGSKKIRAVYSAAVEKIRNGQ